MEKKFIIAFIVIILTVIIMFTFFKYFFNGWLTKVVKISGPVEIGQNWLEIRPNPQLKAERNTQDIWVGISLSPEWDFRDDVFIAPNGDKIKIEVQLIDTQGAVYNLDSLLIGRGGLGFSRAGETSPNGSYSSLPQDKMYNVVKIRSDKPLKADWVEWVVSRSK